MNIIRRFWGLILAAALVANSLGGIVFAAPGSSIVINEVAWAGTADSSNDEWIELYNNSNQAVDLSGWKITDSSSTYTISSGLIQPYGYFLVEDSEQTITTISADSIIGISLTNTGERLALYNAGGTLIDEVNAAGGTWPAGDAANKSSMERKDPSIAGTDNSNWASATSGNASLSRNGGSIMGTPKGANSVFSGSGLLVEAEVVQSLTPGSPFQLKIKSAALDDLFSYGLEVNYDPSVISFSSAVEGSALKSDGGETAFYAELEDDVEGKIIIANSRLEDGSGGIDFNGAELLTINFDLLESATGQTTISFGAGSFLSDSVSDIPVIFKSLTIDTAGTTTTPPVPPTTEVLNVTGLTGTQGTERYSIKLTWSAPGSGADSYLVERKSFEGSFVPLGTTTNLEFIDKDSINNGGSIIPELNYHYRVKSIKSGSYSSGAEVAAKESRGIKGDNNRSDRVDGRDLDKLARLFAIDTSNSNFDKLKDTNYDGRIDGQDLLDIGYNFGVKYSL